MSVFQQQMIQLASAILGFNMPSMPLIRPILPFWPPGAGSSSQTTPPGDDGDDDNGMDFMRFSMHSANSIGRITLEDHVIVPLPDSLLGPLAQGRDFTCNRITLANFESKNTFAKSIFISEYYRPCRLGFANRNVRFTHIQPAGGIHSQDQLLYSWLLSSMTEGVLTRVVGNDTFAQVWKTLQTVVDRLKFVGHHVSVKEQLLRSLKTTNPLMDLVLLLLVGDMALRIPMLSLLEQIMAMFRTLMVVELLLLLLVNLLHTPPPMVLLDLDIFINYVPSLDTLQLDAIRDTVVDNSWYPDSGATSHYTTNDNNFTHKELYLRQDQIHMGDGAGLQIQNVGLGFQGSIDGRTS
uniref:Uncharacterized protein n=1 Tax=Cannabis sativa TaxID=3483 RepID=A0A803NK87_CANSA